nr:Gag-Pol polyprotein [Tanacetum cinerariifolium]
MLRMHDGTVHSIRDVRYVKGPKKNLLSLQQLDDLGCKVEIQKKIMQIIKGALVLMKGENVAANLKQLKGEIMKVAEAYIASHSPIYKVTIMWHHKLGHMFEQGRKIIVKGNLLSGLLKVYPIKKNFDVCEIFKVYKARVELDFEKKIKCLRKNNRERMNKTLLERARAILETTILKKSFWAEAVNTACYMINRLPSTAIELKTLIEIRTGKLSSKMIPSSTKERMEMSRVPYASIVGSFFFVMICARPDIVHAVGVLSQYMANSGREYWEAVKRILRYIKGTSYVAL